MTSSPPQLGTVAQWTPTAQFARTVHNAFAHGSVNITDTRSTGSWRGVTATADDNGAPMLFNFLGPGDVLSLCLDLDAEVGPIPV